MRILKVQGYGFFFCFSQLLPSLPNRMTPSETRAHFQVEIQVPSVCPLIFWVQLENGPRTHCAIMMLDKRAWLCVRRSVRRCIPRVVCKEWGGRGVRWASVLIHGRLPVVQRLALWEFPVCLCWGTAGWRITRGDVLLRWNFPVFP